MVDLEGESDGALARRIRAELDEGAHPDAIAERLLDEGAEPERVERLLAEARRAPLREDHGPAAQAPPPRGSTWIIVAGAGCLLLGVATTLITGTLAYGSLIAGAAALVLGLRQRAAAGTTGSHALAFVLLLLGGTAVILLAGRFFGKSEPESVAVDLGVLPQLPGTLPAPASARITHASCRGVTFAPGGGTLATYGGKKVRLWNVSTRLQTFVQELDFEPERVVVVDQDRVVIALGEGRQLARLDPSGQIIDAEAQPQPWVTEGSDDAIAVRPEGDKLVTGGSTPELWSLEDRKRLGRFSDAPDGCTRVAVSSRHVVATCDEKLALWNIEKPRPLAQRDARWYRELTVSPGGKYLVASGWASPADGDAGRSYYYDVFDLESLDRRHSAEGPMALDDAGVNAFEMDATFDAKDSLLVIRTGVEEVTALDPPTGKKLWSRRVNAWGYDLDLAPDASLLAVSSDEVDLVELGSK